jgi:hypothetical protein
LVDDYFRQAELLGREPDVALLAPIIKTFQRLQGGTPERDTR